MSQPPGSTVGGQAVIEGVMIRSPQAWSVAVRRPDGEIETRTDPLPRLSSRSRLARIPFIRGVMVLGESLTLGFRALTWSAQIASTEEDAKETARLEGVVEKVTPGGLHLRLPAAGPGVRGFLPQEELGLEKKEEAKKKFPPGTAIQVAVLAIEGEARIRLSRKALLDQEDRGAVRSYLEQGRKSDKMATLGDLFKDLKLPKAEE